MTPDDFIEVLDRLSRFGFETITNYEIIVAGHPGEVGVTFHENSIIIDDKKQQIIIWVG